MTDWLSSKRLVLILGFGLLLACGKAEPTVQMSESEPQPNVVLDSVPEFRIDQLTTANRKDFEQTLPNDVREVFDNASEIRIKSSYAKSTVVVTDPTEKRRLLDSLYWDLAHSYPRDPAVSAVACKETG